MSEGEKMVWAAAFAKSYDGTWDNFNRAAEDAANFVLDMRGRRAEMADVYGGDSVEVRLLDEMMRSPASVEDGS